MKRPAFLMNIVNLVYSEQCKLVRVLGRNYEFISEFPLDMSVEIPFHREDMPADCELVFLDTDIRRSDMITAITPNFWTCNCKEKYVRHIGDAFCELCETKIMDSIPRLPLLTYIREPMWAQYTIHNGIN